jgi:tRNA uridine 5-carbamoylmethylation protein Kti12
MPRLYMLIGVPGSGKSTWRNAFLKSNDAVIISSDDEIDAFAEDQGLTYSDAFKIVDFKKIDAKINADFSKAVKDKQDIIVDRTNMSKKSRSRFLSSLPANYEKHAIIFQCPEEELRRRLDKRAKETGKFIPDQVLYTMLRNYQEPDLTEFDDIQQIG